MGSQEKKVRIVSEFLKRKRLHLPHFEIVKKVEINTEILKSPTHRSLRSSSHFVRDFPSESSTAHQKLRFLGLLDSNSCGVFGYFLNTDFWLFLAKPLQVKSLRS